MKIFFKDLKEDAKNWAKGRFFFFRFILIFYLTYVFFRHILNIEYSSLLGGINLGIHELGHLIFYPLGQFLSILGGSFLQILVPILSFGIFLKKNDYFALSFSSCWLGTSLFNLSLYVGDARERILPLVSPFAGEEIIHDWHYLLSKLGLLSMDDFFSFVLRIFAIFSMLAGILWGLWILKIMVSNK